MEMGRVPTIDAGWPASPTGGTEEEKQIAGSHSRLQDKPGRKYSDKKTKTASPRSGKNRSSARRAPRKTTDRRRGECRV